MNETVVNGVDNESKPPTPKWRKYLRRTLEIILVVFLLIVSSASIYGLVINQVHTKIVIHGLSMYPTLEHYEFGLMNTNDNRLAKIKRDDIIITEANGHGDELIIKRVVGLPNETIQIFDGGGAQDDYILITPQSGETFKYEEQIESTYLAEFYNSNSNFAVKEPLILDDDEYFVLGDNREWGKSSDSRTFGPVTFKQIHGVLFVIQGDYYIDSDEDGNAKENYDYKLNWDWRYY